MAREVTYDAGNEVVVLRAAIADEAQRKKLVHSLSDEEFLVPAHAAAWRALRAMADAALSYSADAMRSLLTHEGQPADDEYLAELEAGASVAPNLDWHVDTMRWDATRARTLKGVVPELIADLEDPKATPERVAASARSVLRAVEGGAGRRHMHRPDELDRSYRADLKRRAEVGNFFPTHDEATDAKLSEGLMPNRTWLIVGLPGSGKSTVAADMALEQVKRGRRVAMAVWEMGAHSTLDIMVSSLTGIPLRSIVRGDLDARLFEKAARAASWITKRVSFMERAFYERIAKGRPNNDRNLDVLEGYLAETGCDLWIYDLWARMLADDEPGAVTRALERQQAMHAEYGVCGVLVHQLKLKDVERRADKRPTRDAIKGVGSYVEVPDVIFGVHRDAQFKQVPDNYVELICLKQRKGESPWAIRRDWDGSKCKVGPGTEVEFDPGLEAADVLGGEIGDVGQIRARRTKGIGGRDR